MLGTFCELLDLDPSIAAVVDGAMEPTEIPGTVVVTPTSAVRAIADAATRPRPGDPWFIRIRYEKPWWYRTLDIGWAALATAWAVRLWPGGGLGRAGAAALLFTAAVSVVDAALPARKVRADAASPATRAEPRPHGEGAAQSDDTPR